MKSCARSEQEPLALIFVHALFFDVLFDPVRQPIAAGSLIPEISSGCHRARREAGPVIQKFRPSRFCCYSLVASSKGVSEFVPYDLFGGTIRRFVEIRGQFGKKVSKVACVEDAAPDFG